MLQEAGYENYYWILNRRVGVGVGVMEGECGVRGNPKNPRGFCWNIR